MKRALLTTLASVGVVAALSAAAQDDVAPPQRPYRFFIDVNVVPSEKSAYVTLKLDEGAINLPELVFRIDPDRHHLFEGDGRIERDKPDELLWNPPIEGGELRYVFRIDHLRDDAQYDARCASSWALFRGDDLVPPARTRAREGSFSVTRVRLRMPDRWQAVTPYPRDDDGAFIVDNPHRDFDRPTGWFLLGKVSHDADTIAGVDVSVASPTNRGARRLERIAMLRWVLPELKKVVPLPRRLTVIGADDPMWRGGLSGPGSIYLHRDRPLIETDYTSPLIHEVIHTVMSAKAGDDGDWIVEGLAEYYGIELLVRSGSLAPESRAHAFRKLEKRAKKAGPLAVQHVDGATTARAVLVLRDLDAEIRRRTADKKNLDDAFRALVNDGSPVTTALFERILLNVTGESFTSYLRAKGVVPGAAPTTTKSKRPPR